MASLVRNPHVGGLIFLGLGPCRANPLAETAPRCGLSDLFRLNTGFTPFLIFARCARRYRNSAVVQRAVALLLFASSQLAALDAAGPRARAIKHTLVLQLLDTQHWCARR